MSNIVEDYIRSLPEYKRKILATPEGRRAACKSDFRLFCFVYFRDIMKSADTGNEVTLSDFHEAFIDDALKYMVPCATPAGSRTSWVCPRGSGKSSWGMMLMIWIGAYYDNPFIALFSATATQSEDMLSNIRAQFNQNELLRADFPSLVKPATKKNEAIKLSDNKQLVMSENGLIITGRGVNTSVLGMRLGGNRRPTMIYCDDLEVGESQTTSTDVKKLLTTILDDIFPLALNAHVVWVGTTTRPGGLTEQHVLKALDLDHESWVDDENFKVNYWPALKDGKSIWEARWSTEFLKSIEHTRSFAKNFECRPGSDDYMYWTPELFVYREPEHLDWVMLSVDPAVTSSERADGSAFAVVGYNKSEGKTYILHAESVRYSGADLRRRAGELLELYPQVTLILAETNNGGDLVTDLFRPLPVKVKSVRQALKKEIRAATALAEYEKGKVFHAKRLTQAEKEMVAFPTKGINDDCVDAIGTAVTYFAEAGKPKGTGFKASATTYA